MNKLKLFLINVATVILLLGPLHAQSACDAENWIKYEGTQLKKLPASNAYFYVTKHMAVDADGAPNAYHPLDKGIDALANAGYPNRGWRNVLVVDPGNPNKPYVQPEGEFKGFFLSKTTLQDKTRPVIDPARYVDSRTIPYMVFPGAFHNMKGTGSFGDLGIVKNLDNGKETAVIVADGGPTHAPLGEGSIRLAENLGGSNVNPRNGAGMPSGHFVYVMFPKSRATPPWPLSVEELDRRSKELLQSIGGWEHVLACASH